ncbi:hypothetical protein [Kineococcus indalonis]|uniref:hypothetical protein n=1 Tax=Kineococcus indalonis TaxID=2696566 RepID=UPI0014135910|nr:hypothetical protein [Kineococcus indalonis]NAZ87029.1 hypothetical protein [Kineococcus indalonis]
MHPQAAGPAAPRGAEHDEAAGRALADFLHARLHDELATARGTRERADLHARLGFVRSYRRAVAEGRVVTAENLASVLAVLAAAHDERSGAAGR